LELSFDLFSSIQEPFLPYIHRIEPSCPLISSPNAFSVVIAAGMEVIIYGNRLVVPGVLEAEENGTWSTLATGSSNQFLVK